MKRFLSLFRGFSPLGALAVTLAGAVAVLSVWWGGVNQDEGWYLYAAQQVYDGKLPYRDFFFTQGPLLPFVYALLSPLWGAHAPLSGLLGGRLVTFSIGLLGTLAAILLLRRLVPAERRKAASWAAFALLAGNLYHVYFTTIPKTYALGGAFVLWGFLLLSRGLGLGGACARGGRAAASLFLGGFLLACASGTRISLVLILPVVGVGLLARFGTFRWAFLRMGLGAALGLGVTYGYFALDAASLRGLLAAQAYHAARGGFDPFFAIGSVSRLVRGYAALGGVLFAGLLLARPKGGEAADAPARFFLALMGVSVAAVFFLQLAAPFPYDDYQVPVMGALTVLILAWFFRRGTAPEGRAHAYFALLCAGMVSVSSPLLQEWAVYGQDRFWSLKKERTELSKLRFMAEEINLLDPGGTTLLTQDLYLAVEAGRKVPEGLEMGPFSYFPDLSEAEARARHVVNTAMLERLLSSAPCRVAAFSGYAFAIAAPRCTEVPFDRQKHFFELLRKNYEVVDTEPRFGQHATTLIVLRRKEGTYGSTTWHSR